MRSRKFPLQNEGKNKLPDRSDVLALHIPIVVAFSIYCFYAILIYWPVLSHQRFFWEDFDNWEYPVRSFNYYMLGIKHTIPFWNPYSWGWEALLSDAQSGFWYPANLAEIALVRLLIPATQHLPALVPEITTIAHLPIAALGMFCLLRKRFQSSDAVALIAGLTFGFGARMAAEQNHGMFIVQLSMIPWEVLLLMYSWNSWKYAIGLGLLFGVTFLAGQPQYFIFIALFLASFTIWECIRRSILTSSVRDRIRPISYLFLAMIVATGLSAIQLLPALEHSNLTLRTHLSFHDASAASMNPVRFLVLFVPKIFGENPGYLLSRGANIANGMWYWEGALYWGVLAEICAGYGVLRLWHKRRSGMTIAKHFPFFAGFILFSILFGLGGYGGIQWIFWKFVPFFDHIRTPSRMLVFVWFIGVLLAAFGMEELLRQPSKATQHKIYFIGCSAIFIAVSLLSCSGVLNHVWGSHGYMVEPSVTLHSLVISCLVLAFVLLLIYNKLSVRLIFACMILLIVSDLYYIDYTWHRNAINREVSINQYAKIPEVIEFAHRYPIIHDKLLVLDTTSGRQQRFNLGMFLRLPIEFSIDSNSLLLDNPFRLIRSFPEVEDSVKRMEIMGVSSVIDPERNTIQQLHPLPFLKLYHRWRVAANSQEEARILNDSNFDFNETIVLQSLPSISQDIQQTRDSVHLDEFSENELQITTSSVQASMLFINDLYYPAWKALVDGKPTNIVRAFGALRAVPIEAGTHKIVMRYESSSFALGWRITVGTLIASFVMLSLPRKQKGVTSQFEKPEILQTQYRNDSLI